MGGGIGRVTPHPDYFLDVRTVSFLTRGVSFRVHRLFFERESDFFRNLFEESEAEDPLSGTEDRPYTLETVTPDEFATFLWVWYGKDYAYRDQTKENWLIILRLAADWGFDKIKDFALREIEALELCAAERLSIYDAHSIDGERLLSSYVELCKSPKPLTAADARFLHMETLINVLQARDEAQRQAIVMGHESPMSACLEDSALREIVLKLIKKSLPPQSSGTSTGLGDQASDLNAKREAWKTNTITLAQPQVPDRKAQTSKQQAHPASEISTGDDGKEREEMAQEKAEEKERAEKMKAEEEREKAESEKAAIEAQERVAKEKAAKEAREAQEKAERERATKEREREEKERAEKEKAKQEKGKEREQKADQRPSENHRGNQRTRGRN